MLHAHFFRKRVPPRRSAYCHRDRSKLLRTEPRILVPARAVSLHEEVATSPWTGAAPGQRSPTELPMLSLGSPLAQGAKIYAVAPEGNALGAQKLRLPFALGHGAIGPHDSVPGHLLRRRRENAPHHARCPRLDVPVRSNQPCGDRSDSLQDSFRATPGSILAFGLRPRPLLAHPMRLQIGRCATSAPRTRCSRHWRSGAD
jgi:hypothetical protein